MPEHENDEKLPPHHLDTGVNPPHVTPPPLPPLCYGSCCSSLCGVCRALMEAARSR